MTAINSQDFLPVVATNSIPQKTFAEFMADMQSAWAAFSQQPGALQAGDPTLALLQTVGSQLTFVESLAAWIAAYARSSTSSGPALDSWMAQFNFPRDPATYATSNTVTLSRSTPAAQSYEIPLGAIFQTVNGVQFATVADSTQTAYQSGGYYLLATGESSITVTVQALIAGTGSNIAANTLNQFVTQVTGVSSVNNPFAISNAKAAESDAAFRSRFLLYLEGLRQATLPAIESAIESVQSGIQYVIVPNETLAGVTQYGYFYATIWPYTDALQAEVYASIANAVALGIQFNVYSATVIQVTVTVTIEVMANYVPASVQSAVQTALSTYLTGLVLGETLYWSYLYDVIYSVSGVLNAFDLLVNGATNAMVAGSQHIIQPQSVVVTVSSSTA